MSHRVDEADLNDLMVRADQQMEEGKLGSAFKLFLKAAKLGDSSAQNNLGYLYSEGKGVKQSNEEAEYWYRKAYRRQSTSAAHNLGILFRDSGDPKKALKWFERAVKLGSWDSNLDLAKIYIERNEPVKAAEHLRRTLEGPAIEVPEESVDEARRLLEQLPTLAARSRKSGRK